ncbi:hypothetical protein BGW36DRAFT_330143 [Talaromyces proteolyticus]|uniref:Zn(2)-C6 fungal-type domain-containing protein n=1 Tax=Talaromyces proteolyticus TaxID=1131652 RepID=A0AAD4KIQ0_9EURO|nr:uncharacterized protein BGW36DRAFT_330143 [Talaromyces proteolyticus]KAH8689435.1 hypothetical protein BGW36DRAFT_330143 [Talaromyces proteolyticus]
MPQSRSRGAPNMHSLNKQGRPQHACSECHARKRKCHASWGRSACKRCLRLNIPCSHQAFIEAPIPSGSAIAERNTEIFPSQEICNQLVDLYFDLIHDKDHALFHRPSFITAQRQGLADMMHVSAMMALGARFASNIWPGNSERWSRGRLWANYSKHLFDSRIEVVSLAAIQACVLLSTIAFCEGEMEMESLYGAQAIRMIQLKGRLTDSLPSNPIQRETAIRVWWTVWMLENWTNAGARIPRQLTVDLNFPLPMEEHAFEQLSPEMFDPTMYPAECRAQYGIWAQMIPLTEVIAPINEMHEMTVRNRLTNFELFEHVERIAHKLDSWKLRLPDALHATPDNLKSYAKTGHARSLAALHTGFHHFSQLLYYQFLQPSISKAAQNDAKIVKYATRCREHAAELSNLLWLTKQTPDCQCMWPMIGHLLAISSSIHLHTLLFDDDESNIANVKHMLKQNFEMMISLRQYWPSIDLSMSRLRNFHQACQRSMNTTFNMDHWMLQFLQRYTKPVGERETPISVEIDDASANWPTWPLTIVDGLGNDLDCDPWYNESDLSVGSDILQSFL